MEFRPAVPADVEEVLALWQVAGENADRPVDHVDAVDRLVARDPDALLLAVEDSRIVGTVIAGWDGWRAHLYRLAVHPDRRHRGVGRPLLDAAADRLVGLGAGRLDDWTTGRLDDWTTGRLDAMVLQENAVAHRLWEAAGYTPQPRWRRWVRPVGTVVRRVR